MGGAMATQDGMDVATDPVTPAAGARRPEVVPAHASKDTVARVRLSVCVPTYNRPGLVGRAIASIVAAASDAVERIEIVVSDNSPAVSEDASRRALAGVAGRLPLPRQRHQRRHFSESQPVHRYGERRLHHVRR